MSCCPEVITHRWAFLPVGCVLMEDMNRTIMQQASLGYCVSGRSTISGPLEIRPSPLVY